MQLELLRKTDLALRAIRFLAPLNRRATTQELAEAVGSSAAYAPQVMNPLVRQGWVVSQRGPTGGYSLAVDPAAISMRALIEAVEGPIDDGRCVLRSGACDATVPCAIHDAWTRARSALIGELDAIPLYGA